MMDPRPWLESIFVKAGIIGALGAMMLWPLSRVEGLIAERQSLQHQADAVIADGFGGPEVVAPPVLGVETEQRTSTTDSSTKVSSSIWTLGPRLQLTPDAVDITSDVGVEVRSKGMYKVPVYVATLSISGEFKADALNRLLGGDGDVRPLPAHATLRLPLSRTKYVRSLRRFEINGQTATPVAGNVIGLEALCVPIDLTTLGRDGLVFQVEITIGGSESLTFLPLGSTTQVSAHVGWPHPDFVGAFLPASHETHAKGYSASWQVLALNRAIPSLSRADELDRSVRGLGFGVRLLQPSDLYTMNYRAVRYGILFVCITFACFFMWEHRAGAVRLHPIQYLLVGLALATFYVLLLALSEHVGFGMAYGIAVGALVGLISNYFSGAADDRPAGLRIGAALATAYGLLYIVLLSEDYALLFGASLLFATLSGLMLATRRTDWANV